MRLPERSSRGLRAVRLANEGMEQTKPAIAQNEAVFAAHPRCSPSTTSFRLGLTTDGIP